MFWLILFFLVKNVQATQVNCRGHDACKNYKWTGAYDISCGGSNSERTCRGTTLNCEKDETCTIKTTGSGHDAYQQSTVNAKEANSFTLTCAASGHRDCQSITIWCPQKKDSTCNCVGCGSSVTMKCVQGSGCKNTAAATIDYVTADNPEKEVNVWTKDTSHTGKRPDCPFIPIKNGFNYIWASLEMCFSKCIDEPTGNVIWFRDLAKPQKHQLKTTIVDFMPVLTLRILIGLHKNSGEMELLTQIHIYYL
jgi:hypothetical protein